MASVSNIMALGGDDDWEEGASGSDGFESDGSSDAGAFEDPNQDEDAAEEGSGPRGPSRKRPRDARYALPTAEELQQLRSAQDVLGSNLLSLQAAELLGEVKPDYGSKTTRKLEAFLHKLRELLQGLPEVDVRAGHGVPRAAKISTP